MLMGSKLRCQRLVRLNSQLMFLDVLKCLCKTVLWPITSLLCDLARKKFDPLPLPGTVNWKKGKQRPPLDSREQRKRRGRHQTKDLCLADVCGCVCVWCCTSSLRSDPGFWMYHRIWACWDLGIHSRNVELLCTPKRTLSSTRPPTRPKTNIPVIDPTDFLEGRAFRLPLVTH